MHHVEKDEIGTESIEAVENAVAVADTFNLEPRMSEVVCQHVRQGTIVFDEKETILGHRFCPAGG